MSSKLKLHLFILLFLFTNNIFSQPNNDFIVRKEFISLLDSLIKPPASCDEAWSFVTYDPALNDFKISIDIKQQVEQIDKLISELSANINYKTIDKDVYRKPPGDTDPDERTMPSGSNLSDELRDLGEDFQDADLALTKLTETKEQYKDEIKEMQFKMNEKLHKTFEADYDAHILIVNEFMKFTANQYRKHILAFRENMNKIDAILKKYDNGPTIKSSKIKSEFLKLQFSQAEYLKFLTNITKELTVTGAKFYKDKFINSQK